MRIAAKFIVLIIFVMVSCKQKTDVNSTLSDNKAIPQNENSFMMKAQQKAIAEDYVGLTTAEGKQDSLFYIKSTGVSTAPIAKAATAFIESLAEDQLKKTQFAIEDDEWRKWSNVDNGIFIRQGISIKEMTKGQRNLAFNLMSEALSAKGLQLTKDIMKTDQTLREMNDDNPIFDEELYFFTIMGEPSQIAPWGWQIDGHHLVINYFILGDQVVMTPTFLGGEPIVTTTGKYKGNTLFQDEQNIGLKFMQSLSADEQKAATISKSKGRNDAKAEAFKDNAVIDYQGINISTLDDVKQMELIALAEQYISTMREGHSKVKIEEIKKHINTTFFAWIGNADDDAVFYYRIHSPVILIEFDHQGPVGVHGAGRDATRNHIHTVVRTPNGNDYGKDLLRQHLEEHH